jgi:hypothetical protein
MPHSVEDRAVRRKKPYKKPQIKEVPLRPEEAVLGYCKKASTSGPLQSGCNTPSNCSTLGS